MRAATSIDVVEQLLTGEGIGLVGVIGPQLRLFWLSGGADDEKRRVGRTVAVMRAARALGGRVYLGVFDTAHVDKVEIEGRLRLVNSRKRRMGSPKAVVDQFQLEASLHLL